MNAAAELGRNPVVSKHPIQHEYLYYRDDEQCGTGLSNPSRETKFSGANGDCHRAGENAFTYILLAMVEAP